MFAPCKFSFTLCTLQCAHIGRLITYDQMKQAHTLRHDSAITEIHNDFVCLQYKKEKDIIK